VIRAEAAEESWGTDGNSDAEIVKGTTVEVEDMLMACLEALLT